MVTTNDDPPEFPDEISTSSKKAKLCVSLQPCRISSVQIPEELLYEVFLRLPVKSLLRFRWVSKGMRRLIDSPIFIKNHNIHRFASVSADDEDDYVIVLYQPRLHRLFSVNFNKDDDNNLNRAKAIELNSTFVKEGLKECMVPMGWCNGIFGFRTTQADPQSYVFWNPSNGTFRKVDCSSRVTSIDISMGYDYVNDDYKIIRFLNIKNDRSLEVYSFRKDSWRKFPRDFPSGKYGFTSAVCLGGVIHWVWINRTDKSMFIAAFDLATETFTSIPLPLEARQLQLRPSHFTDFRGRLCITFLPPGYPSSSDGAQTIWVMEKYGVESSWTKLYDFDNTSSRIHNFYFPNTKRRLLCNSAWLSWWDPQDGSFEEIEIPGLLNDQAFLPELYLYDAHVYFRNLVRLDQSLV